MKHRTLFKLCGEFSYLSYCWKRTNGDNPVKMALLMKLWSLLYFIMTTSAVVSPVLLITQIFKVPHGEFRSLGQIFLFCYSITVSFFSLIVLLEYYRTRRTEWSIFNKTYEFTDALVTLLKAILRDTEASENDLQHLAWTSKKEVGSRRKRCFPARVVILLDKRLIEIAEAIKEYDLIPQERRDGVLDFNYDQDKAFLNKLFKACKGFGLFPELTLAEIYRIAKQNVLNRKKYEEEESQKTPVS